MTKGAPDSDAAGELVDGEAVVVRATDGDSVTVVSGKVALHDDRVGEATIREGYLWEWHRRADEPISRRRIKDIDEGEPQKQESYRYRPRLDRGEDGQLELIVFAATYDSSGVRYYAPHSAGTITELKTGAIITPGKFLNSDRNVVK